MNEETRAHTAWLACGPVGLVAVPQQSVEVQQGSVHRFDNFENFSRLTSKIVVRLAFPRLHVDASAVAGLIEWYCNRLGTSVIKEIKSEKELIPQAGQAHYVRVRFSEVIWSEYTRIISVLSDAK